jgi:hypothetical protein
VPADREPPPDEVLAALVVSLRAELAEVRAELAQALERGSSTPWSSSPKADHGCPPLNNHIRIAET